jgi:hypothetical protein
MARLTNDERVKAATGQFKTNKEAEDIYTRLLKETREEIDSLKGSKDEEDKERVAALKDTVKYVTSAKNNLGYLKAAGGGLFAGATEILSFPIDIAFQIAGKEAPSVIARRDVEQDGLLFGATTLPSRATTEEVSPVFGGARGVVQLPLRTPAGTAIQSILYGGAGAVDDSGMATTSLAGLQLAQGIYQLGRLGLSTKKQSDILKDLPENEKSILGDFLLKGQTGSDPKIAELIKRLKTSPETAEIVNALEEGAKKRALSGMAPEATEGPIANPVYQAIQQKLKSLNYKISGQPIQRKYDRARQIAGADATFAIPGTIRRIDDLIATYVASGGDSAEAAIRALEATKTRLLSDGLPVTTIDKIQGNLNSFGARAAGEENLIKNVTLTDQRRIATAVFGGLKQDLATLTKAADPNIRKAALTLEQARSSVQKGYAAKNSFIAQGLPDKLKNVDPDSLDDETLVGIFKGLSKNQRDQVLPILDAQAPEAVNRLRSRYYNDFLSGATRQLDDGTYGVDFKQIVDKYNTLGKADKELLAFALGTNADEFGSRMKDATDFFRYNMKITGNVPGQAIPGQTERATQAAIGSIAGYQVAKGADVAMQVFNRLSSGLSDTDVLKILITPQGRSFLKNAKLSPASVKTLEGLETIKLAEIPLPQAAINLQRGLTDLLATPKEETDIALPEQGFDPVLPDEEDLETITENEIFRQAEEAERDAMSSSQPLAPRSISPTRSPVASLPSPEEEFRFEAVPLD